MLRRTPLLQIDGNNLPMPDKSPEISYTDIESGDSGQDEAGVYHREVLRYGVLSCNLKYDCLLNEDCAYLLGLLQNKNTFSFTCPVSSVDTAMMQTTTRTCYCANYGAAIMRLRQGIWRNVTLDIQEC